MSTTLALVIAGAVVFFLLRGAGGAADPALEGRVREAVAAGGRVIDVRTAAEFRGGHAPGARNVPLQALSGRLGEVGPKDKPVVLYCRSGNRSGQAARLLAQAGYEQIIDGRTVGIVRRALEQASSSAEGSAASGQQPANRAERRRQQRQQRRAR